MTTPPTPIEEEMESVKVEAALVWAESEARRASTLSARSTTFAGVARAMARENHLRILLASHASQAARLEAIDQARFAREVSIAGKSLGEKLHDAVSQVWPGRRDWRNDESADVKTEYERVALAFVASLTHAETASAVTASQADDIRALGDLQNEHANLLEASRRQDEEIADHVRGAEESAGLLHEMREQLTAEQDRAISAEAHVAALHSAAKALLDSIDMDDPAQWNCSTVAYSALQEMLALTQNQGDDHDPA